MPFIVIMITKTSSHLYDISILKENGTNFQMWKYWICTVLDIHGLLNIAERKEQCSSQILVTGTGNNAAKAHAAEIEKIEDWDHRNFSGVIYTKSAADAWNKLNHRYEGRGHQMIA